MPLNRLLFLLFTATLIGSLIYLLSGTGTDPVEPVALSPKAYMERVEAARETPQEPARAASPQPAQSSRPPSD
jgi:hypothetical protein